MNELAWPFERYHYIALPNSSPYCHSDGDAVTTLRALLGVDGPPVVDEELSQAIRAWESAHDLVASGTITEEKWHILVEEQPRVPEPEPKKATRRTTKRASAKKSSSK